MTDQIHKVTHHVAWEIIVNDGIKRRLVFTKWDDLTVQFSFVTYWDGLDKEPTRTGLRLSPASFNGLFECMNEFMCNMDKFRVKNYETEDAQKTDPQDA